MKRSEIDAIIERCIATAGKFSVALPKWAAWAPSQFDAAADGLRHQGLGWKVVDFGRGDFSHCGLALLVVCNSISDNTGEPVTKSQRLGERNYPVTSFSRKFLFVQPGQTEPHHFHRRKQRKEVTVLAGGPVRFELAWADNDTTLSQKEVDVQVDGIWHHLPANGALVLHPGETITLPAELSHIIQVLPESTDAILLETSTANNDRTDNIFPFITPSATPIEDDAKPRYQLLDEHVAAARR
jgi:D-lyxose ketol-isomerase